MERQVEMLEDRPDLQADRLETVFEALDHTYDHVVIDASDDMIGAIGTGIDAAVVVSEFGSADPRTVGAFERIGAVCDAPILLLIVDGKTGRPERAEADEAAA